MAYRGIDHHRLSPAHRDAAVNRKRLPVLGLDHGDSGWVLAAPL